MAKAKRGKKGRNTGAGRYYSGPRRSKRYKRRGGNANRPGTVRIVIENTATANPLEALTAAPKPAPRKRINTTK